MKANELRIGNFINYEQTTHVILTVSTTEADEYAYSRWIEEKGAEFYFHTLDIINPIHLTEEWLIKFGFEKVGSNYQKAWLLLHGNIKTGTMDFLLNEPITGKYKATVLQYVHQLQNIYFCLTGEELTINP